MLHSSNGEPSPAPDESTLLASPLAIAAVAKPYRTTLVMNSIPTNVSTPRTATSTSANTMPNAIMRSLAASLLMSQDMLERSEVPHRGMAEKLAAC